jgi:hypothetical protein
MADQCEQSRQCDVDDWFGWGYYGFTLDVNSPETCPILVQFPGQSKTLAFNAFNQYGNAGLGGEAWVDNSEEEDQGGTTFYWVTDQYGRNGASVGFNYTAGTASGPDVGWILTDTYDGMAAEAVVVITWYPPPPLSASFSGTGYPPIGSTSTWTGSAGGGVPPYSYQWLRDGVAISGATSSTYSLLPTDRTVFNLSLRVTPSVGTAVTTAAQTIRPTFDVTIDGPTYVSTQFSVWTAGTVGGGGGLTYQWYWDQTPTGTNSSQLWDDFSVGDGSYILSVNVTDGYGNQAGASLYVTVCRSGMC